MPTTRVVLTRGRFENNRGQTYDAYLPSLNSPSVPHGSPIVVNSHDPEHAVSRALKARGATGRLEIWREGATSPALIIADIEQAAERDVFESAQLGLLNRRHRPFVKRPSMSMGGPRE